MISLQARAWLAGGTLEVEFPLGHSTIVTDIVP